MHFEITFCTRLELDFTQRMQQATGRRPETQVNKNTCEK